MTQITKTAIQDAMAAAEEAKAEDLRGIYPMACRTLAETARVLRDGLDWAEAERDALRAFAQAVMMCWPMGDLDGGELQAAAEKHGLLRPETRHEPCGDGCNCAQYTEPKEFELGVTCYRKTALLKGPNAELWGDAPTGAASHTNAGLEGTRDD